MSLTNVESYDNRVVIANAVELGSKLVLSVAGNDVADTLDGKVLDRSHLADMLGAKINGYLRNKKGV